MEAPRTYRFGALLALVVGSYGAVALLPTGRAGMLAKIALFAVSLAFALWTSRLSPRALRKLFPLVAILTAAAVGVVVFDPAQSLGIAMLALATLAIAATAAVGRGAVDQVRAEGRISISTVLGALTVYLLFGLSFATLYEGIAAFDDNPFFAQIAEPDGVDFVYFSLVTLSTTGYGDISAAGDGGRLLAASQGVTGQLYLVTVVALVVGNLRRQVSIDRLSR